MIFGTKFKNSLEWRTHHNKHMDIQHMDVNDLTLHSTQQQLHKVKHFDTMPGGGGYLVYLTGGDVPFFRVSFSPIFSRTGYQKKANFLEQVVKTCEKRKFC